MDLDKVTRFLQAWQGLLAAAVALSVPVGAILAGLVTIDPSTWGLREAVVGAAIVAMLLSVWLFGRRARKSSLKDPEALRLDPRSPDQLFGRKDELDKLLNALVNPLLFLVSESGCGKSALLRAGIVGNPAFTERFLPLYVDMSVLDWEDGPLRAVRESFARALPAEDPARGLLDARSGPEQFEQAFADYLRRSGRRVLLLLDQFDDFQAKPQHRNRFLPTDTRIWRNAASIEPENAFWRMLRRGLDADAVTVLVACREDAAKGLESFRFRADVPSFDLPRLEQGFVRRIVDALTDRPEVIANPDGGWTALKDRLIDDLQSRGALLPQQLKMALGGLRTLSRLTPAAYARAGRVGGLEAAFVAAALQAAARATGIQDDRPVLRMALSLVDRTREPPDKAPPRTTAELAETAGWPEEQAEKALRRLEADEIVRPHNAGGAQTSWQLDHAYLAQPIIRLERERDQWRQLLADRARACQEAGLRGKWGTLLPLSVQAQLMAARLRGRFRYEGHRAYALASLVRVAPTMAVLGLGLALAWTAMEYNAALRIQGQLASFSGRMGVVPEDGSEGLKALTERSFIARWRVAQDMFTQPVYAATFSSAPAPILRALVRLDRERMNALVVRYITTDALLSPDRRLRWAVIGFVGAVSPDGLTPKTRAALNRAVAGALERATLKADMNAAIAALELAVAALPPAGEDAVYWTRTLRSAIPRIEDPAALAAAVKAYMQLTEGSPLPKGEAPSLLSSLRAGIARTAEFGTINELTELYRSVVERSSAGDVAWSAEIEALRKAASTSDINRRIGLRRAIQAVLDVSPPGGSGSTASAAAMRAQIMQTDDRHELVALGEAYRTALGRLPADQVAAERLAVTLALGTVELQNQRYQLVKALAALSKLSLGGDAGLLPALRLSMTRINDSENLRDLANEYVAAISGLDPSRPDFRLEPPLLREALLNSDDSDQVASLSRAYLDALSKLRPDDPLRREEGMALRHALLTGAEPVVAARALTPYAQLRPGLQLDDRKLLPQLRAILARDFFITTPPGLLEIYSAIIGTLPPEDPLLSTEAAEIRRAMLLTSGENLAAVLDLAGTVARARGRAGFTRYDALREAVTETSTDGDLESLGQAHAYLTERLEEGHPSLQAELEALAAALRNAPRNQSGSRLLAWWAQAYAGVSKRVAGPKRHPDLLPVIAEAIARADGYDQLPAFAEAYAEIGSGQRGRHAQSADVVRRLRESMSTMESRSELAAVGRAYAVALAHFDQGGAGLASEVSALREASAATRDRNKLEALLDGYRAALDQWRPASRQVRAELAAFRDGFENDRMWGRDRRVLLAYAVGFKLLEDAKERQDEAHALRELMETVREPQALFDLVDLYTELQRGAPVFDGPQHHLWILLSRMAQVRHSRECLSVADVLDRAAASPSLTEEQLGRIYAAALLQPTCAGTLDVQLVNGFENQLKGRLSPKLPAEPMNGSVWAFADWARRHVPGFDPHRADIGFLAHRPAASR